MEDSATVALFKQKRQEVALLYDLYVAHVSNERDKGSCRIPDSFVITASFAKLFTDLKLVAGYMSFVSDLNRSQRRVSFVFPSHQWLTFRNKNQIIDVIPIDGEFGLSVPQAVIQRSGAIRFFQTKNIFPSSWDSKKMQEFEKGVEEVSLILKELMQKVPH